MRPSPHPCAVLGIQVRSTECVEPPAWACAGNTEPTAMTRMWHLCFRVGPSHPFGSDHPPTLPPSSTGTRGADRLWPLQGGCRTRGDHLHVLRYPRGKLNLLGGVRQEVGEAARLQQRGSLLPPAPPLS